jgi:hypothetical protein
LHRIDSHNCCLSLERKVVLAVIVHVGHDGGKVIDYLLQSHMPPDPLAGELIGSPATGVHPNVSVKVGTNGAQRK